MTEFRPKVPRAYKHHVRPDRCAWDGPGARVDRPLSRTGLAKAPALTTQAPSSALPSPPPAFSSSPSWPFSYSTTTRTLETGGLNLSSAPWLYSHAQFPVHRYVGEWFDPKGEPGTGPVPLDQQREQAVHGLWVAVVIYAILFGVSAVFACIHKLRGSL